MKLLQKIILMKNEDMSKSKTENRVILIIYFV